MSEVETHGTVQNAANKILNMMDGTPSPEEQKEPETPEPEVVQEDATHPVEDHPEPEVETEAAVEPTEETVEDPVTEFTELADHLNVEEEFLLNLEVPTKVNGEERKATIKDLLSTFQKSESADVKLMELAEDRKKFDAEQSQVNERLQQEWGRIQALQTELDSMLSGDESKDLESLRYSDPAEYAARVADRNMRMERAEKARREFIQANAQRTNEQYTRHIETEKKRLLHAIPEWNDEKTASKEMQGIRSYLKDSGWTDADIDGHWENGVVVNPGLVDHRAVTMARKAWLYDSAQKSSAPKQKKLKSLPKVGSGKRKTKEDISTEQSQMARQKLKESGTVNDAAEILKQIMES